MSPQRWRAGAATADQKISGREAGRQYVLFVPDGAADRDRVGGLSPVAAAHTPNLDFLAREGVCGRMLTLFADLPRESMVAQLGMLGWDPRVHYPHGRASCELLALEGTYLGEDDLAFRANLVRMDGPVLASYSADLIPSAEAFPLVARLDRELRREFPDLELYHNADFRNTLVVRGARVDPRRLVCPPPHESHGQTFDLARLVQGCDPASQSVADQLNRYLVRAAELLAGRPANALFPWSASRVFRLSPFAEVSGFTGRAAIVGFMDFLKGIACAGGIEFARVGNGRPDTDYSAKGQKVIELLDAGYEFILCHVNAPDEASHLGDRQLKIECIEAFDRDVVGPAVAWLRQRPARLGGVMVAPDHYTNYRFGRGRAEAHSLDPVPFCLWNGIDRDGVQVFSEAAAVAGRFGLPPVDHLALPRLLAEGESSAAHAAVPPLREARPRLPVAGCEARSSAREGCRPTAERRGA